MIKSGKPSRLELPVPIVATPDFYPNLFINEARKKRNISVSVALFTIFAMEDAVTLHTLCLSSDEFRCQ